MEVFLFMEPNRNDFSSSFLCVDLLCVDLLCVDLLCVVFLVCRFYMHRSKYLFKSEVTQHHSSSSLFFSASSLSFSVFVILLKGLVYYILWASLNCLKINFLVLLYCV